MFHALNQLDFFLISLSRPKEDNKMVYLGYELRFKDK